MSGAVLASPQTIAPVMAFADVVLVLTMLFVSLALLAQ